MAKSLAAGVVFLFTLLGSLFIADRAMDWAQKSHLANLDTAYTPLFSEEIKFIDRYYTVQANRFGIRYREIPLKKSSAEERRTAVLGDSFVEGTGVDGSQTFTSLMEKEDHLFINCGINGGSPPDYLKNFNKVALSYDTDDVMVMIYANDLADIELSGTAASWAETLWPSLYAAWNNAYSRAVNSSKPSRRLSTLRYALGQARLKGISREKINNWVDRVPPSVFKSMDEGWTDDTRVTLPLLELDYWVNALDGNDKTAQRKWMKVEKSLEAIRAACQSRGITFRLVYAPHPYQYDAHYDTLPKSLGLMVPERWLSEETLFQKRLSRWAKDHNVFYLDLTDSLKSPPVGFKAPFHFGIDPHWNDEGHRLVAKVLLDWLAKTA